MSRLRYVIAAVAVLLLIAMSTGSSWCQFYDPDQAWLRVGDWLNPEPWHNWIGGHEGTSRLQLHILDPYNEIYKVDFYYSLDEGYTWEYLYTDYDGYEPNEDTIDTLVTFAGDGWSAYLPHSILPQYDNYLLFKSVAFAGTDSLEVYAGRVYDPTPPSAVALNYQDWDVIETEIVELELTAAYPFDIDTVIIYIDPKDPYFEKGIPGISQQPHSPTHCAPTAMAACLKYFEAQGDTQICGGLSDFDLVNWLAFLAGTNIGRSGTLPSDLANGTRDWISVHGDGYTVRGPLDYNWKQMRDELERCQDVLSGIYWDGGGGHRMTLNSIDNYPLPTGELIVDFMDPWTGQTEYGLLTPSTGQVEAFTGAGTSGKLGNPIIVCPKETNPGGDGPGSAVGGTSGPLLPPIPIPLPSPGDWWIHVIIIDSFGNAYRAIIVISWYPVGAEELSPVELPAVCLTGSAPNPFTDRTEVSFSLPAEQDVTIEIYNVLGQRVRTLMEDSAPVGVSSVVWDGRDERGNQLPSGVYFSRMVTSNASDIEKIVLMR
jgi:hypothetical protein